MAGKGDKPRPVDKKKFTKGWEAVFGKQKPPKRKKKGKST